MKLKHHAFVTEYLKHRDAYLAYVHVYNVQSDNYIATLSSANRLLNRPDISAAIQSVQDAIRADVEYELRQELKKELLTVQRKRELLAQIATGEMYVMQYYKGKDCSHCSQHVAPTINQMLRAIDLDSRLAGHYPDTKHQSQQIKTKIQKTSPPESGGEKSSQRTAECFSGEVTLAPEPHETPIQSQQITTKAFPSSGGVRGGSLAKEVPKPQQPTTTKTNVDSPPVIRRGVLHDLPLAGSSATGEVALVQEIPEPQQTTTKAFPSSGGVRGGSLEMEVPESQQITTKTNVDSPPVIRRGVLHDLPLAGSSATGEVALVQEIPKPQQITTKVLPSVESLSLYKREAG